MKSFKRVFVIVGTWAILVCAPVFAAQVSISRTVGDQDWGGTREPVAEATNMDYAFAAYSASASFHPAEKDNRRGSANWKYTLPVDSMASILSATITLRFWDADESGIAFSLQSAQHAPGSSQPVVDTLISMIQGPDGGNLIDFERYSGDRFALTWTTQTFSLFDSTITPVSFLDYLQDRNGEMYLQVMTPVSGGYMVIDYAQLNIIYDDGVIPTTPVPEPEVYAMLLTGLSLLGFAARRRKLRQVA